MNGVTRLDYLVIQKVFCKVRGISKKQQPALFHDLQIMEVAAMNAMYAK